ncbi:hypothetical protein ENUP19_0149G0028 [Entamoeba nuttalli]|uniref:RNB family domain containing protein n=2 Tax=Entamoeba nuttalli TaxID=412467 RepID=K2HDC4_ENTNP|nr:RNB family domain containing protein [Entamoeba nuttalli P19]EKE40764.1 RNB family domain containing protein [Entamoeba nuttalli P19]|eukprot:XP_008856902.1 RNB family domain containing protein [Entamoeba nuttalli P19]
MEGVKEEDIICIDDSLDENNQFITSDDNDILIIEDDCKSFQQRTPDHFISSTEINKKYPRISPLIQKEEKTNKFIMKMTASNHKISFKEDNENKTKECFIEKTQKYDEKKKIIPSMIPYFNQEEEKDIFDVENDEVIDVDSVDLPIDSTKKKYVKGKKNPLFDFRFTFDDFKRRTDICMRRAFTVDSDKTKIRDDAFHVEVLEDDTFEIGIHSVDCSDFVGISKDPLRQIQHQFKRHQRESKTMSKIKENMSFDAGTQRRALSLIIVMNGKGQIIQNPQLCLSMINIRCNLNSEQFNCLLNNTAVNNPLLWKSYGTYETFNCGKIYGTTLPQLKNDIISLHNVFCYHIGKKHKSMLSGNDLVQELGIFLGRYISQYLYKIYGEYALVISVGNQLVTQFRSPLRKYFDVLVLKQLVCAMEHENVEKMSQRIIGRGKNELKRIIKEVNLIYEERRKLM